jgi:hypothetical protein
MKKFEVTGAFVSLKKVAGKREGTNSGQFCVRAVAERGISGLLAHTPCHFLRFGDLDLERGESLAFVLSVAKWLGG